MKRVLFWALFGVTLAVYGTMLGWSLPTISAAAGGLPPFDMRPGGYSFAEAQAFLLALSADGVRFYHQVQHTLDLFYPALIASTLFVSIAALLPMRLGVLRFTIASPAFLIALFDYQENRAVAAMLDAGPAGLNSDVVAYSSLVTMLKSGMTTIAMTALLGLLGWHALVAVWRMVVARRVAA